MAGEARRAYREVRSSASTHQPAIFAETLRDAPILPARFVAALARCAASRCARLLPDRGKIGSVAAMTIVKTGSKISLS
jgi:hypothetical protein